MFAIDINLLVYSHNTTSPFHKQAKAFVGTFLALLNEVSTRKTI